MDDTTDVAAADAGAAGTTIRDDEAWLERKDELLAAMPERGDRSGVMNVVVVGASSGLGRSIAVGLGGRGSDVALLARRHDRLEEAIAEIDGRAFAIRCDATDQASCRDAIDEAAASLGRIDAVLYAPGYGPLARLADIDADTWRQCFDTNVMGASLVTAAALPHLVASAGVMIYLSTVSASITPPWPGLGAYAVTKAALDKLVDAWRGEYRGVGFSRIVVGDCAGGEGPSMTEFNAHWDMDLAGEVIQTWMDRAYLSGTLMDVEELIRAVDMVVRCGASASISQLVVSPRPLT